MNTEFKGTKGEWRYKEIKSGAGLFHCIVQKRNHRIVTYVMNDHPEFVENAKLIADAGNTIQSCGLFPSELLKQRDELIKALKESQNMLMGVDWSEDEGYPECQYVFERNQKLLESTEVKH